MRMTKDVQNLKSRSSVSSVALLSGLAMCLPTAVLAQANAEKTGTDLIATLSPSPSLKTSDGQYSVRLAGFYQIDHVENDGDRWEDLDGSTIRRARYGVRGTVSGDWNYDLMIEGGGGNSQLFDANVTYTGFKNAPIRVGQFKEPMGLEWSTGAPWWTFMDRALLASLAPKRSIGVATSTGGKMWRAHVGHFTDNSTIDNSPNESGATTGRFYVSPVHKPGRALHLGVSSSHRSPDPVAQSVRFKAKHETAQATPALDTGLITGVDHTSLLGVEALGIFGPASIQAEYLQNKVHRDGDANVSFSSAYVQATWSLTGEVRPYKFKKGGFGRIKPSKDSKTGAIELAVRFDTIDLNDGAITGGSMDRRTLAANWYPTTNIRLSANVTNADTDENAIAPGDDPSAVGLRAQFAF